MEMETDNNNNNTSSPVCFICHTFFANPSCENMCSSCFKSAMCTATPPTTLVNLAQKHNCSGVEDDGGNPLPPKKSGGCWSCKKKVAFAKHITNKCRCGHVFCDQHRQAEAHDCEFDYKVEGRERIERANPLVRADKINRI